MNSVFDIIKYHEESPSKLIRTDTIYAGAKYKMLRIKPGDYAGYLVHNYWLMEYNNKTYRIHNLIYKIFNGDIPNGMIVDHINGDSSDNSITNLRLVTHSVNSRNRKKQKNSNNIIAGVYLNNKNGNLYWQASWSENFKIKSKYFSIKKLGNNTAFDLAVEYRQNKIKELNELGYGYTERHGK